MPSAPSTVNDRRLWIAAALALVASATAVRFALNFATIYPPGIDAAYYPLQTRAWMTTGRLMYDDLPLIFWMNAGLAKALIVAGGESNAALLLASRIVDCVGPPWAAAFVMAAGYDWSGGRRDAIAGSAAAAIVVVLWPPAFSMLSEFQKNSLGLVWMAAAVWAAAAAMRRGGRRRWATLGAVMVLSALTHIGAFGVTALMVGLALAIWIVPYGRGPGPIRWRIWIALTAIILTPLLLLAIVEPQRLMVLARTPMTLFGQAEQVGVGGARLAMALVFIAPIVVIGLRRVWLDRRALSRADIAIIMAAAITVFVLVVPKNKEHLRRFTLMLPVPAAAIAGFVLARRPAAGRSPWPGRAALAGAMTVAGLSVLSAGRLITPPQIDAAAAEDLQAMRAQIPEPVSTLVIATHGLEWWSGYFLHTPVRVVSMDPKTYGSLPASVPPDAFQRYRRVLVVRQIQTPRPNRPAAPGGGSGPSLHLLQTGRVLDLYEWR